jgi:Ca2+-transporting ATPase
MICAQLLFTYWSPMNRLFGSAPIENFEWLLILIVGLTIYSVIEIEKKLFCHFGR